MAKKKKKAAKKKTAKRKPARKKTAKKKTKKKKGGAGTWSKADIALLKKMFPKNPTAAVAKKLKRGTDAVKKKASRMGLKKNKSYLKKIGRA